MTGKTPDKGTAIHRAKEIIKDLLIEEPSDIEIEAIAYKRGAIVKEESMQGAEGRLATLGSQGLITVCSDIIEVGKKRFVIAHELGHYELHRKSVPAISCSEDDFLQWNTDKLIEVEANYFAGELLMPEDMFRSRIVGKALSYELLNTLSEIFFMSLTAVSIRFATLRPEYALVCSSQDRIKWFVVDRDWFPLYLNIGGKVHSESIAYEYFQGNSLPREFSTIDPVAWTDWKVRGKLKELAIPLGKYNQVLSFLIVEEGWDD